MKRTKLLACLAAAALCTPAFGQTAGHEKVVAGVPASELAVSGLQVGSDGSVTGSVVNHTGAVMRDVKLLVTHTWYWKNERHPGDDSPGRSGYVTLPGEIAPKGSTAFSYTPNPALPTRSDGTFQTTVSVQSFTQVGE